MERASHFGSKNNSDEKTDQLSWLIINNSYLLVNLGTA